MGNQQKSDGGDGNEHFRQTEIFHHQRFDAFWGEIERRNLLNDKQRIAQRSGAEENPAETNQVEGHHNFQEIEQLRHPVQPGKMEPTFAQSGNQNSEHQKRTVQKSPNNDGAKWFRTP